MTPYHVIAIVILVLGCATSYFFKAGGELVIVGAALMVLEVKARAARDRQRAKDARAASSDDPAVN